MFLISWLQGSLVGWRRRDVCWFVGLLVGLFKFIGLVGRGGLDGYKAAAIGKAAQLLNRPQRGGFPCTLVFGAEGVIRCFCAGYGC